MTDHLREFWVGKSMTYRIRLKQPDGKVMWLGERGYGPTDVEDKSPVMTLEEAKSDAAERNRVWGPKGYYYEVVPVKEKVIMREMDAAKQDEGLTHPKAESEVTIPIILYCPVCHTRHIDEGEYATKPHHTHACQSCGTCWRPALVPTVGVQFLPGFKNKDSN